MYEIFSDVPPRTKILAPPLYNVYSIRTVYLSIVTCAPQIFILVRGGPHDPEIK